MFLNLLENIFMNYFKTKERHHKVTLSTENQSIFWSPCNFDQSDKSSFKVVLGAASLQALFGVALLPSIKLHESIFVMELFGHILTFW